jgi:hypothetical protein
VIELEVATRLDRLYTRIENVSDPSVVKSSTVLISNEPELLLIVNDPDVAAKSDAFV